MNLLGKLIDIIYPPRCTLCQEFLWKNRAQKDHDLLLFCLVAVAAFEHVESILFLAVEDVRDRITTIEQPLTAENLGVAVSFQRGPFFQSEMTPLVLLVPTFVFVLDYAQLVRRARQQELAP